VRQLVAVVFAAATFMTTAAARGAPALAGDPRVEAGAGTRAHRNTARAGTGVEDPGRGDGDVPPVVAARVIGEVAGDVVDQVSAAPGFDLSTVPPAPSLTTTRLGTVLVGREFRLAARGRTVPVG